ncbi:MAG: ATP-dependent Clp protease ATP-binding subunit ClpA [Acidobacteria bacterium]|nr:MAG: ATP-dependent Clp protease ATP-binding subunit ClpA [Acidobacteriota bacterium]PIE90983.1 MAG: ATP-dependent Clp protease ATP-binding subunit ClpA [Acidobacteriota bacterium]
MINPRLERCLNLAFEDARTRQNEYLTLEHILIALIEHSEVADIISICGGDPDSVVEKLKKFLKEKVPVLPEHVERDPQQTLAIQRVLQRAAVHIQSAGKSQIDPSSVLASLFQEKHAFGVYVLKEQGLTRLNVLQAISHALPDQEDQENKESSKDSQEVKDKNSPDSVLEKFTVELVDRAQQGRIDPLIGRETEIRRVIQTLCRRKKNNPLLVGDPGVGKTAIAEGLALRIAQKEVPEVMLDAKLFALDMGALLANTKFRGEFEARLKSVIKALIQIPHAILFIDEIHTIVGAGATSGGTMDASNILKPVLASGELKCMGSTTYEDFKSSFEKDRALSRRFHKIDIVEPSVEETFQILKGLKGHYEKHHAISYSNKALKIAAELAAKHLTHKKLPDKAIDVIDEVGAAQQLHPESKRKKNITVRDIERTVAEMARIPSQSVSSNDKDKLQNLERDLGLVVYGQDQAIHALCQAIKLNRSGLRQDKKTVGSFLFTGPTGVGKTEIAKQLARILSISFIRFDMSEYMEKHSVARLIGAPPGYVGFDQGGLLTDAVNKTPYAVLLLDEIEKAHPDIFNILLQVMDHATLTDHNGKSADFRNIILIMTSNAGAKEMARNTIGFGDLSSKSRSKQEVERFFSPEFRNRLDGIIHFGNLSSEIMIKIVEKFLAELQAMLTPRKVTLDYSDRAMEYLANKGYSPTFGARPLHRLIDEEIKKHLAEELLFGKLTKGGEVFIDVEKDTLVYKTQSRSN